MMNSPFHEYGWQLGGRPGRVEENSTQTEPAERGRRPQGPDSSGASRCSGTIPPSLVLPLQPLLYKAFAQGTPAVTRDVLDDVVNRLDVSCTLRARCSALCRNISTFFLLFLFGGLFLLQDRRRTANILDDADDDDDDERTNDKKPCNSKHFTQLQTPIDQEQSIRTQS